jgi:hypothetical protein
MLVPKRFRGQHAGFRASFFAAPQPRPMGAGRDLYGLRKDSSEFPVEIGLNPIEIDEHPMVLASIVDITDRKQKEEQVLAAIKEKKASLAGSMPDHKQPASPGERTGPLRRPMVMDKTWPQSKIRLFLCCKGSCPTRTRRFLIW